MQSENKYNILVLGVGGNVSQGILKALKQSRYNLNIIVACIAPSSVGLYLAEEAYICPKASDKNFVKWYIQFCNKHKIDMTFTGVEENISILLDNRAKIESECNTKFVYPNYSTWVIGNDKYLTCKWLEEHNLHYPKYMICRKESDESDQVFLNRIREPLEKIGFPIVCKPRCGKSASGTVVLDDFSHFSQYVSLFTDDSYVIEQCIGTSESEYTVGCYCDKQGEFVSAMITRRILKNGSTSICSVEENNQIYTEIYRICNELKNPGPVNIQLRLDSNGNPVCFELNVRFSGTTAMRNEFGFHDIDATITEYLLDSPVDKSFFDYNKGCAIRFEEEKYFSCSYEELKKRINGDGL